MPITQRLPILCNRRHEFACHKTQRFRGLEVRRQHVAVAIGGEQTLPTFRIVVLSDALVIHLDLLAVLHVVIHNHFFAPTFFFSSRSRHTNSLCDWSSDVCSSDLKTSIFIKKKIFFYERLFVLSKRYKEKIREKFVKADRKKKENFFSL